MSGNYDAVQFDAFICVAGCDCWCGLKWNLVGLMLIWNLVGLMLIWNLEPGTL